MVTRFADPFEALFQLQRQLESRLASNWLGDLTAARGAFPPINLFQQGHDFVAIVDAFRSRKTLNAMRRAAMGRTFAWHRSAMGYKRVYDRALAATMG